MEGSHSAKYKKLQNLDHDDDDDVEAHEPMVRQKSRSSSEGSRKIPRPSQRINITRFLTSNQKVRKFACLIQAFLVLAVIGFIVYVLFFEKEESSDNPTYVLEGQDNFWLNGQNQGQGQPDLGSGNDNKFSHIINDPKSDFLPKIRILADGNSVASAFSSVYSMALGIFGRRNAGAQTDGEGSDFGICPKPELFEIKTELNIPDLYRQLFPNKNKKSSESAITHTAKEPKLKVYVMPHSHNDAGWGETFEDYYRHRTKSILDHLLKHLTEDPEIKFIWSETCFFDLWWSGLTTEKRDQVKKLVANKQLEFVGGGWVMPDEATPYYLSQVTQLIEGHQWLRQHLNYTPSNGWVIDPFGISSTSSFLQQRSGLKNTVFSRIHYVVRKFLIEEKKTEFYWRQPWDFSGNTDIYAYQMPYGTYDIGATCGPEQSVNPRTQVCRMYSPSYAVRPSTKNADEEIKKRAELLLDQYKKKASLFHTYNVLQPIGADFAWQTDNEWTKDIQTLKKIFKYINSNKELNTEIKFATLNDYFEAVHNDTRDNKLTAATEAGWKPSVFSGDFFTYADRNDEYWSGYYTSRIFHKGSERELMTLVRSSQLIYTMTVAEISKTYGKEFEFMRVLLQKIVEARRTLSLFQHHDGITGTSTNFVVRDYAEKLFQALNDCHTVIQQCIHVLQNIKQQQSNESNEPSDALETQLNSIKNDDTFYTPVMNKPQSDSLWEDKVHYIDHNNTVETITIFNSLAKARKQMVRISVTTSNVKVMDLNNQEILSEIFPIFKYINKYSKKDTPTEDLDHFHHFQLFFVAEFRPLEIKNFKIVFDNSTAQTTKNKSVRVQIFNTKAKFTQEFKNTFDIPTATDSNPDGALIPSKDKIIRISNHYLTVDFNENGTAKAVEMEGTSHPFNITFHYYKTRRSGLYLFLPLGPDTPIDIKGRDPVIIVVEGRLRSYVEVWYPNVRHRFILLNHDGLEGYGMHVENIVDIREESNYELIMKISTKIKSEDAFFTDSNGFQMMRRENRDTLPIQGNYYPIASSAYLEDPDIRMTILTAQPGGIASLISGQFEIMVDRKLNQDDNRGIGQGGMDNLEAVSSMKIILEKPSPACRQSSSSSKKKRDATLPLPLLSLQANLQQLKFLHPLLAFKKIVPDTSPTSENENNAVCDYTLKTKPLSCDIHLLGAVPLAQFSDSTEKDDTTVFMQTSSQSALLFHRMGIDGRFKTKSIKLLEQCAMAAEDTVSNVNPFRFGELKVKDIFGDLFKSQMLRTSLSLSHKDKYFDGSKTLELEPMEIYSLIVDYNEGDLPGTRNSDRVKINFKSTLVDLAKNRYG